MRPPMVAGPMLRQWACLRTSSWRSSPLRGWEAWAARVEPRPIASRKAAPRRPYEKHIRSNVSFPARSVRETVHPAAFQFLRRLRRAGDFKLHRNLYDSNAVQLIIAVLFLLMTRGPPRGQASPC